MTVKTTISGVVRDAGGHPVARARVYIVKGPGALRDVAALTGPDGRFVLGAVQAGEYEIGCSTDSLGSATATVEVGVEGATIELRLGD